MLPWLVTTTIILMDSKWRKNLTSSSDSIWTDGWLCNITTHLLPETNKWYDAVSEHSYNIYYQLRYYTTLVIKLAIKIGNKKHRIYFFRNLIPVNFRDILNQLAGRIPTDDTPFNLLIPVRLSLYGLKSPCFICSSLCYH